MIGSIFNSFDVEFGDVDNDGDLDFLVVNWCGFYF